MSAEEGFMTREELRVIPKIELHNHLEGMIRLSTIIDLCEQFGVPIPGYDKANPSDVSAVRHKFLNSTKVENIEVFFNKFWEIQSLLRTDEAIERITFEACEDCYECGVRLVEFRYSPSFINRSNYSDHSHLTFESVLDAIKRGIASAQAKYDLAVGLICIVDRSQPIEEEASVFNFFMDHKDDFVGIDIANDEIFPCKPYAPWYNQARAAGLGLTCHAGESSNAESVRITVETLGVSRIGHGFLSIHDPTVIALLKEKGVLLEICPVSNNLTNSVESLHAHPMRRLYDEGVLISINSDDAGVFDSSIIDDYEAANKYHSFTAADFLSCNLAALNSSFLSQEIKDEVKRKYFSS